MSDLLFVADATEDGTPIVLDMRREPASVIPFHSDGQAERVAVMLNAEFEAAALNAEKGQP